MMQQKHFIDKLLFGEKSALGSKNQAKENLFEEVEVSKEMEAIEDEKVAQGEKNIIAENKEHKWFCTCF